MKKNIFLIIFSLLQFTLNAQQITKQDYERAASFLMRNISNKKVYNWSVTANWFADSSGFSYITQKINKKLFNKYDLFSKVAGPLFDHERLAKLLTKQLKKTITAADLPVTDIRYIDKMNLTLVASGKTYTLNLTEYTLTPIEQQSPNLMERVSPDGQWIAYTDKYNLFIKSTKTGGIKQLSSAGKKNYEFASFYRPMGEYLRRF